MKARNIFIGAMICIAILGVWFSAQKFLEPTDQRAKCRDIVQQSRQVLQEGETVEVSGETDDILIVSSKQSDSTTLLKTFGDKSAFRNLGFKKIVATGKSGDKRETDLTK